MNWSEVEELSQEYGESFFIFDRDKLVNNFQRLSYSFNKFYPNTKIGYSYKTNYTPTICKLIENLGGYAEIVSEMELELTELIGIPKEKVIYNGPFKSENSLRKTLLNGSIVNLDSERDLNILSTISKEHPNHVFEVALRCNFSLGNDLVSRFGFDVTSDHFRQSVNEIANMSNVKLSGLHCHFPDRALDTYTIRIKEMLKLVKSIFSEPPKFINIGGGFFGHVPESLAKTFSTLPPSFEQYAETVGSVIYSEFSHLRKLPILFIEPGTAIVADTFRFYTKILNVKNIRGTNIATAAGSIFNISPTARNMNLPVNIVKDTNAVRGDKQAYDIGGFTCIEGDYLTKGLIEDLQVGDFAEYHNVGSYSIVMKPPFILPNVPIIMSTDDGNELKIIKKKESTKYIFQNFTDI
jgi:diaminopimelate decarboxylase